MKLVAPSEHHEKKKPFRSRRRRDDARHCSFPVRNNRKEKKDKGETFVEYNRVIS